jgi:hypothetical protein
VKLPFLGVERWLVRQFYFGIASLALGVRTAFPPVLCQRTRTSAGSIAVLKMGCVDQQTADEIVLVEFFNVATDIWTF